VQLVVDWITDNNPQPDDSQADSYTDAQFRADIARAVIEQNVSPPSLISTTTSLTDRHEISSIRNTSTGETLYFSTGHGHRRLYKFRKLCQALDKIGQSTELQIYMLTVTVQSPSPETERKELSRLMNTLQRKCNRAGFIMYSVWVKETQEKRYTKTGVKAPHWHIAIAVPRGTFPDIEYLKEARRHLHVKSEGSVVTSRYLFETWGNGMTFSQKATTGIYAYLGKYMAKELENYIELPNNSRRFGSSSFGRLLYPKWAQTEMENIEAHGVDLDDMRSRRLPGKVAFFEERITTEYDMRGFSNGKLHVLLKDGSISECEAISFDENNRLHYWALAFELRTPWHVVPRVAVTT